MTSQKTSETKRPKPLDPGKNTFLLAVMLGALLWLTDATIDTFFFYKGSFPDLLLWNIPAHEIYTRLAGILMLLIFATFSHQYLRRLNSLNERLEENETRLQTMLEYMPVMMDIFDENMNIIFWNKECERVTGYASEEIIHNPKALEMLYPDPDYRNKILQLWEKHPQDYRDWERIICCKDGSRKIISWSNLSKAHPIPDWFSWGIGIDVTEQRQAEDALRASEDKFRTLVQSMHDVVFTLDSEKRHTGIYGLSLDETHMSEENFIGKTSSEILGSEIGGFHDQFTEKALQGEFVVYDWSVPTPDGTRYYQTSLSPLHNENDEVIGVVGVGREITQLKQVEDELRHSRDLLHKTLSSLDESVIIVDPQTRRVIDCNPKTIEIFGYTRDELVGHETDFLHVDEDHFREFGEMALAAYKDPGQLATEYRMKRSCGEIFHTEHFVTPVRDESGQITFVISVIRDITERKIAEEALRESEEKFRQLVENIEEVLWIEDLTEKRIIYISPSYEKVWGKKRADLYRDLGEFISSVHPEDLPEMLASHQQSMADDKYFDATFRIIRPDNTVRWIWSRTFPIVAPDGSVKRLVGLADDITEHKQAEEALKTLNTNLEQIVQDRTRDLNEALKKEKELGQLKSRFVTMVSHEFRTPLTSIATSSELLEEYGEMMAPDQKQARFEKINQAIKNMTHMLEDVLVIGRAESGRLEFNPTELDLYKLCVELVQEIRMTSGKHHKISFEMQSQCPRVQMDPALLNHMLTNLFSNAIKYSEKGTRIILSLNCDGNRIVTFHLIDEGIGIPQEDLERLFEPFYRAKNVETIAGTGLGLAIVKRAVDIHNGKIDVQSQPGQGTTFTVMLPVHPGQKSPSSLTSVKGDLDVDPTAN